MPKFGAKSVQRSLLGGSHPSNPIVPEKTQSDTVQTTAKKFKLHQPSSFCLPDLMNQRVRRPGPHLKWSLRGRDLDQSVEGFFSGRSYFNIVTLPVSRDDPGKVEYRKDERDCREKKSSRRDIHSCKINWEQPRNWRRVCESGKLGFVEYDSCLED